jgi:penicillin V acylase-like amidase (Ntn superfamily)
MKILILLVASLVQIFSSVSYACTTFSLSSHGQHVLGRTLDWFTDNGMVVVNPRGVEKTALLIEPSVVKADWISKFASVTFTQTGREMPFGGMNEQGLVVESMWLDNAKYPAETLELPAVNESQWIQFMLDQASTVADVKNLAEMIRIQNAWAPLHYLVCDLEGACATFEYINHVLVVHDELPIAALANDEYETSLSYSAKYSAFGGTLATPTGFNSQSRFMKVASGIAAFDGWGSPVEYAWKLIDSVTVRDLSQGRDSVTQWMVVYDQDHKQIQFKSRSAAAMKTISLEGNELSCAASPAMIADMNQVKGGELQLHPYTNFMNAKIINRSDYIPFRLRFLLMKYPLQSARCAR